MFEEDEWPEQLSGEMPVTAAVHLAVYRLLEAFTEDRPYITVAQDPANWLHITARIKPAA